MSRRTLLRKAGLGCLATALSPLVRRAAGSTEDPKMTARPKNIILITTHDSGRQFGCYGVPTVQTPAIDRLAAGGCTFDRFFSVNPICSPSRASLATGRYPQSHGVMTIVNRAKGIRMNPDERPIAMVLGDAGFKTALFGLQHESPDSSTLGFQQLHDAPPRKPAPEVGLAAGQFIRSATEPFFLQVGFFESHTPYDFGGAKPEGTSGVTIPPFVIQNEAAKTWMEGFQGAISQADRGVHHILRALEESGQADDTLVIFTVDHGIELPRAKWFLYDPGVGVALVCRWPKGGIVPGSRSNLLLSNIDLFPSILDLLGLKIPDSVQGKSFAAALRGEPLDEIHQEIYAFQTGYQMRSVRTDTHKLIRNFELHPPCTCPGDVAHPRQDSPASPLVELYDLQADPLEFRNLAGTPEHREIQLELTKKMRAWMLEQKDPILALTPESDEFHRRAVEDLLRDA